MSRILEIQDLDFDGDRLLVRAVVEDAVLVGPRTACDPPEWGACRLHWDVLHGRGDLDSRHRR
jgi:hypothetical protein